MRRLLVPKVFFVGSQGRWTCGSKIGLANVSSRVLFVTGRKAGDDDDEEEEED